MKTYTKLKPKGRVGKGYKQILTKDFRQLQGQDFEILKDRMKDLNNYTDKHRDEGILFLKQLKLI